MKTKLEIKKPIKIDTKDLFYKAIKKKKKPVKGNKDESKIR